MIVLYYLNARHVSDRQERRRPVRRRGGGDQRRPAGRGLDRLRRALPSTGCSQTARPGCGPAGAHHRGARGASDICSAARAMYLQIGAMLGTIMVGNAFFVIIPAHWELVRAKQAGREPDPAANARAKLRSVHNNYLTLPVVFTMLSNHFPFTYGRQLRVAHPRRPARDRSVGPALLQPAAHGPHRVVDPGERRPSRSRCSRS